MSNMNFINPLPPERERESRVWFSSTLALVAVVFITIISLHVMQLQMLTRIKKERQTLIAQSKVFEPALAKEATLVQEKNKLISELASLKSTPHSLKSAAAYLNTIMGACTDQITLESLTITDEKIELTARCGSDLQAMAYINALASSPHFANITLASLQHSADQKSPLLFRVHGSVASKKASLH